ncbi:hypothetical protein [Emcibacter sp.]|uniref:hypothetical protein n=1 Tax=Emcibacter sp. TaxID=1979954 RepID=UPI002AA787C8|nr:hypothetical protein [Emcibacter sp.]
MHIDDKILTAYLDSELGAEEMSKVAEQVENNPELARQLEQMHQTDKILGQAYREIDDRPVPDSILKMLEAFPEEQAETADTPRSLTDTVVPFKQKQPSFSKTPFWQMAVAASIALVIGVGIGRSFLTQGPSPQEQATDFAEITSGIIRPGNALYAALEEQPSTVPFTAENDEETVITPILTFQSADDKYCREFTVTSPRSGTRNVACRHDGEWVVEIAIATGGHTLETAGDYQTATGITGSAIDDVIAGLIKGEALDTEQEARVIKQHWN